jgi:hypothetical protein
MKLHFILLLCILYTVLGKAQSLSIRDCIGDYQYNILKNYSNDTITGMAFFATDSFAIIYEMSSDGGNYYHLYRGVWKLQTDGKVRIIYTSGAEDSGTFYLDGEFICIDIRNSKFLRKANSQ